MTDPLHDTPKRWDSWAQWAVVIIMLLIAIWHFSGDFAAMRQELSDVVKGQEQMQQEIHELQNRYPFPAPTRVQ